MQSPAPLVRHSPCNLNVILLSASRQNNRSSRSRDAKKMKFSKFEWALLIPSALFLLAIVVSLLGGGEINKAIFSAGAAFVGAVPLLLVLAVVFAIYFLPTIVANRSNHHNAAPIFILNLFLGWTLLGWVAALIWSLSRPPPAAPPPGK